MLNKVNLDAKLKKSDLKKLLDEKLGYELGKAQRAARDAGMPVIMVFEGWRHSRREDDAVYGCPRIPGFHFH